MSRYVDIEGDWVDDAIKTYSLGYYEDDEYAIPIERFEFAPSIDIVRCKDCKYWYKSLDESGKIEYFNFSGCTKGHYGNGLGFYCADGERKE